ncbi:MAG: hypothetical protein ACU84Q_13495 [Gammaproteobacteria bacterium]
MSIGPVLILILASLAVGKVARADVVLSISSNDFSTSSVYNDVANFNFEITIAGTLSPGVAYVNPPLRNVSYTVVGVLASPTPSGFPGFNLVRNDIVGADFYNLSPESGLSFTILAGADLSDGLQLSELSGATDVLYFNAREFNQAPGRYHPPILRLNSDGTGSIANADNASIFPNPPPPTGSGMLVDVEVGEEYEVNLNGGSSLALTGPVTRNVRVPLYATPLIFLCLLLGLFRLPKAGSRANECGRRRAKPRATF